MKNLITIFLLTLCFAAKAQQHFPHGSQSSIDSNRGVSVSNQLILPIGDTISPYWSGVGSIRYNSADSTPYVYTGTQWIKVIGSGGAGGSFTLTQGYGVIVTPSPATVSATVKTDTAVIVSKSFAASTYQILLGFTPENVSNKATSFGTINNTLYPTVQAVNTQVNSVASLKVNIADTGSMLTAYLRKSDTAHMLSPYLLSGVAAVTYQPIGSYAPTTRTISVNGTTQDLSANRTFTVTDANLSTLDVTTNNVSSSKHGFAPKNDGNSAHFLDGTGAYSTPSGTGVTSITAGAGLSGGVITTTGTIAITTVNATPGTYGSGTANIIVIVNALGQITNQATVTPTPAYANVTGTPTSLPPSGAASGDLTGTYPSPTLATSGVTAGTYGSGAAIPVIVVDAKGRATGVTTVSPTPGNLTGDVTSTGLATTIGASKVTSAMIVDGTIVNADISASAAIAYSKLNLSASIVNGDITNGTIDLTAKVAGLLPSGNVGSLTGGQVGISGLSATGAASSSTFLRGDNTWSSAGTGTVTNVTGTTNQIDVSTGTTTPVISLHSGGTLPGAWALGTPASMVGTNLSGTGSSFTAGSATILATSRNIFGESFNGSANVTGIAYTSGEAMLGSTSGTLNVIPAATITSYTWVPPSSIAASTGMVMQVASISTNTMTTAWATPSGGGTPGGSTTQVQINTSGAFTGTANFTYNTSNDQYNIGSASGNGFINVGGFVMTIHAANVLHINTSSMIFDNQSSANQCYYANSGNQFSQNSGYTFDGTTLGAPHIKGTTSAPTIAAGAGAGTSPTVSIGSGSTDLSGYINVTTGTLPTLSATVATITFNQAYGASPHVTITPANSNASLLSGATMVFVDQATGVSTTTFIIKAGTTALIAATAYQWWYAISQ